MFLRFKHSLFLICWLASLAASGQIQGQLGGGGLVNVDYPAFGATGRVKIKLLESLYFGPEYSYYYGTWDDQTFGSRLGVKTTSALIALHYEVKLPIKNKAYLYPTFGGHYTQWVIIDIIGDAILDGTSDLGLLFGGGFRTPITQRLSFFLDFVYLASLPGDSNFRTGILLHWGSKSGDDCPTCPSWD